MKESRLRRVSSILTLLLLLSCTPRRSKVENYKIIPSRVTFPSPGSRVKVELFHDEKQVRDFTLKSRDPNIVSVDGHFLIAVNEGTTTVQLTHDSFTGFIHAVVKRNLKLDKIFLVPEKLEITEWKNYSISVSGIDDEGNIFYGLVGTFSSENPAVATAKPSGEVEIGAENGTTLLRFYCCGNLANSIIKVDLPSKEPYGFKVIDYSLGVSGGFGLDYFPGNVLGPPRGGDPAQSSPEELLSLGNGGEITIEFANFVTDGPGADFIVFENPMEYGDSVFTETAFVEVSQDGKKFIRFPPDYNPDGKGGVGNPANYTNLAGVHPVYANPPTVPATDPRYAGGDQFDLKETGLKWIRYVKIIDTGYGSKDINGDVIDDAGNHFPCGPDKCGFDLDAVSIIHSGHEVPPE